nr:MAG TPA: hypothetical protein [Caudoviricetes sp.]
MLLLKRTFVKSSWALPDSTGGASFCLPQFTSRRW